MHMHAAGVGAIQQYISRFGVFFDPARVLFCVRVTQARYAANMRGAAQRSAAQRSATHHDGPRGRQHGVAR